MSTRTDENGSGKLSVRRGRKNEAKLDARQLMTDEELGLKEMDSIPRSIEEVKRALEEKAGLNASFDLVFREMVFGSKKTAFFFRQRVCERFGADRHYYAFVAFAAGAGRSRCDIQFYGKVRGSHPSRTGR